MLKTFAIAMSLAVAVPSVALACEMHSSHLVTAEATVTPPPVIAPAPEAVSPVMQSDRDTMTRALQSLPFEPTTSLNNNPYEVNCTRNKKETVYYTN